MKVIASAPEGLEKYLAKEIFDLGAFKINTYKRSVSQAQVAINWCCYQGAIPLVGLRKKSQVIDVSNVFRWNLNKSEFKVLQELSKKCLKKMPKNPFSSI